jgi:hypothetical protein
VGRLSNLFRNPFSFLSTRSRKEDRVTAYLLREHDRGRSLPDILDDPFVRNRLTPQERDRLLDRPEVIRALGEDAVAGVRADMSQPS